MKASITDTNTATDVLINMTPTHHHHNPTCLTENIQNLNKEIE